ncbi:MAG: thiamine diphosphokinase [Ruminococcaceae bacterium]|nr:thiamine diphosphokinase [Oscillospiraceae bacterium]
MLKLERGDKMNTCYIACALDAKLDFIPDETDLVIGADRGCQVLLSQGKRIDLAVGDFDSGEVPNSVSVIKYPVKKDETDGAIAIKHAIEKGYNKIRMYGAIGGLLDHTIAIISTMCFYAEKGVDIALIDGENVVFAIHNKKICFSKEANGRISVFSHTDKSFGVFEKGLLYTIDNFTLDNKTSLGSGNSFIGCESEISVDEGTLLIYTSKNNFDNYLTK